MAASGDEPSSIATHDFKDNEVSAYAEEIAQSLALPMVMHSAIQLDVFEVIAKAEESRGHGISAAEIADGLPTLDKDEAADKLERMLRMLAAFSVVTCSVHGGGNGRPVYALSPVGRYFVRDEDNASFAPFLSLILDHACVTSWRWIKEAILGGGTPFNQAHGMSIFEYSRTDPRFKDVFNSAMLNHTTLVMKKFLQHYDGFDNIKQLVDVGGGLGHALKMVVAKYPTVKGINFDLPHVIEHAISYPGRGIDHVSGDMFDNVPGPAEVVFLKWILHNWSDEHCVRLLKNCYDALLDNGKVIVLDHVLPDEPETTTTAKAVFAMDVMMMTKPGGRERTRKEFTALADAAGFATTKFACYVCNYWVMEFLKY